MTLQRGDTVIHLVTERLGIVLTYGWLLTQVEVEWSDGSVETVNIDLLGKVN